jgi:flagellar assembly protein FliH
LNSQENQESPESARRQRGPVSRAFIPAVFPSIGNPETDLEFESARRRGYSAGYAEGVREGEAEYRARVVAMETASGEESTRASARSRAAVTVLITAARALDRRVAPVLAEAELSLVAASSELAEAILGQELRHGPTSARSALARALDHDDAPGIVSVRMNGDDLGLITPEIRDETAVTFIADPALGRGDAIAQLEVGLIDARIGTALQRARQELMGPAE